jgi:Tol biopolymer transport system component
MAADGSEVRQLTTPWTEDYLDAIPSGDARGNTDPDISPDGRYAVFTNLSSSTQESFVLRLDLQTGDVMNLTNVTVGAVPVADANPRFSPDGSRIAFNSSFAGGSQIYVMRSDGSDVRALTNDDYANVAPAWSPDGKSVLYSSYRGQQSIDELEDTGAARVLPTKDWFVVITNVETGRTAAIAGADRLVLRPTWSPDGRRVAFISVGPTGQPDIYVVGSDGRGLRPLQATIRSKEAFIDWR